jgi:hypothetical protein
MLVAAPRGRRGRRLVQRSRSLLCAADLSAGRPVSQPRLERLDGRRPALLHDHERIAGDRAGSTRTRSSSIPRAAATPSGTSS